MLTRMWLGQLRERRRRCKPSIVGNLISALMHSFVVVLNPH